MSHFNKKANSTFDNKKTNLQIILSNMALSAGSSGIYYGYANKYEHLFTS